MGLGLKKISVIINTCREGPVKGQKQGTNENGTNENGRTETHERKRKRLYTHLLWKKCCVILEDYSTCLLHITASGQRPGVYKVVV